MADGRDAIAEAGGDEGDGDGGWARRSSEVLGGGCPVVDRAADRAVALL
jgi:hypothetical protein